MNTTAGRIGKYYYTVLGKLLYKSNILHITSYFCKEVIYYSYILLYHKSNSIILLVTLKVIILCKLVTSYLVTPKVYP